jgi:hypothetical protein
MSATLSLRQELLQQWMRERASAEAIRTQLQAEQADESTIEAYVAAFKKSCTEARLWRGFLCIAIGAFIGFLSFLLTFLEALPESWYAFTFFGLTTAGISVICLGLYYLLEAKH